MSTHNIAMSADYKDSPTSYFQNFNDAWDQVEGQILKLETRQEYREPGNPSYEALIKGNFDKALELLPESRKDDIELYKQLSDRKVDFIRCRPVVFPVSDYLKWELECYRFNSVHGERIYFTDRTSLFDEYATNDFIIFDNKVAVIHNYDQHGEIQGGWIVQNIDHIENLIMLFSLIKASSIDYLKYMINNKRES